MQTFMPYSDFREVAECLDNKRLGKQRVEAWQIYQTLKNIEERDMQIKGNGDNFTLSVKIGWEHHPIVKMWKGYEASLLYYCLSMIVEWKRRGFQDTMHIKVWNEFEPYLIIDIEERINRYGTTDPEVYAEYIPNSPIWVYDNELQLSHQSNLVRKFPEHYKKYFPNVPNNLPYKWVV